MHAWEQAGNNLSKSPWAWYQACWLGGQDGRLYARSRADDETAVRSLKESDRRRYAAIEAAKLGHGGIDYIASVLGCDPKTIRPGLVELESKDDRDPGRSVLCGGSQSWPAGVVKPWSLAHSVKRRCQLPKGIPFRGAIPPP